MIRFRILLIMILFCLGQSLPASARDRETGSSSSRYTVRIDMKDAYIGGLCIIKEDGFLVTASIMNEFGVSLMTVKYDLQKDKIRLESSLKPLKRPAVKRILKKDFKILLNEYLASGKTDSSLQLTHENTRHDINYNLIPL